MSLEKNNKGYEGFLDLVVRKVYDDLKTVFEQLEKEAIAISPLLGDMIYIAKDYTLRGGKRLRAFLIFLGYNSKQWKIEDLDKILPIMSGIELLQSYLLIHDDIMDKDEKRRGGPTVHVWFKSQCLLGERYINSKECQHYGISQAITTGDYLEAMAVGMLAKAKIPSDALADLIATYSSGLRKVAFGQYLDVLFSQVPLNNIDEDDIILIHQLKTASYTVELPLHLGAIASTKYNKKLLEELSNYALSAGIAFQLRDDIIGLYGDPRLTGKPIGSDVRSKKKTLLIVKAYKLADENTKNKLKYIYDVMDPFEISDDHIKFVQDIVKETGSLSYNEAVIDKYVEKALTALEESREICDETKEVLKWLTNKLAYRDK
ncbi:MAG: polyprenyl synthetase family protein [Desulfurococcaceae archaeon]